MDNSVLRNLEHDGAVEQADTVNDNSTKASESRNEEELSPYVLVATAEEIDSILFQKENDNFSKTAVSLDSKGNLLDINPFQEASCQHHETDSAQQVFNNLSEIMSSREAAESMSVIKSSRIATDDLTELELHQQNDEFLPEEKSAGCKANKLETGLDSKTDILVVKSGTDNATSMPDGEHESDNDLDIQRDIPVVDSSANNVMKLELNPDFAHQTVSDAVIPQRELTIDYSTKMSEAERISGSFNEPIFEKEVSKVKSSTTDFANIPFDFDHFEETSLELSGVDYILVSVSDMNEIKSTQVSIFNETEDKAVLKNKRHKKSVDTVDKTSESTQNYIPTASDKELMMPKSSLQAMNSTAETSCAKVFCDLIRDNLQQTSAPVLNEDLSDDEIENSGCFNSFSFVEKEEDYEIGTVLNVSDIKDGHEIKTSSYEFETAQDLKNLRQSENEDSADECNRKIEEAEKILCEFLQKKHEKTGGAKNIIRRIPDEVDAAPTRRRSNLSPTPSLANDIIQSESFISTDRSNEKKVKKSKLKKLLRSKSQSSTKSADPNVAKLSKKSRKSTKDKKTSDKKTEETTSVFY